MALRDLMLRDKWRRYLSAAFVFDLVVLWALTKFVRRGRGVGNISLRDRANGNQVEVKKQHPRDTGKIKDINLDEDDNGPLAIAMDLDGTLKCSKGEISARSVEAIAKFHGRGGAVIIATGTPIPGALKAARSLDCDSLVISSGGATVLSSVTGEICARTWLDLDTVCKVTAAMYEQISGLAFGVECEGIIIATSENFFELIDCQLPGVGKRLRQTALLVTCSKDMTGLLKQHAQHGAARVLAIHDKSRDTVGTSKQLQNICVSATDSSITVNSAGFPGSHELKNSNVSKGTSLKQVCALLHIPASRVVAFGDMDNDISMLEWAGTGVAVANATPDVKKVANRVSPFTNDEDAVAREIEQILASSNETFSLRENIYRLHQRTASLEHCCTSLETENLALESSIRQHEQFVEKFQRQSPAKFQSPIKAKRRQLKL
mmetsp:Transcript_9887/g.16196  ORF Transcript_9887/g.16196 Transcript_9887/m.16196 type:complete len:434 (-) Transcript_9887:944-2245(-)